ncbi:hypothetical protein PACTADRAFT_51963 [Pachysolen tannophilus NRRL Y-2460]|uniref:Leukotriene A(4) hydrolase n=1 Tax=Pachysolen tannophilus NRRL Y-2460 TaxID=669874 RepID=A0A1E4TNM9_PACTA|nr:hypothetical protein PACTADRAFT_51963 [Pachysolen tannophilus NRRL Y-2460]
MSSTALNHISPKLKEIISPYLPRQHPEIDYSTNSNYLNFQIDKTELDISVSFDKQIITGTVSYLLTSKTNINEIILDTLYLKIHKVAIDGKEINDFELKELIKPLGAPLVIKYKALQNTSFLLQIAYSTTKECVALQFMDKEQTTGHTQPYLYSQCEPHYFRSACPSFDTPSMKSTYIYKIDSPLPSLMSGISIKENKIISKPIHQPFHDGSRKSYFFKQDVPIPTYLVAIVSGDIVGAPTGPRSTIYCEPCEIDACKYEFEADMENFIKTAENLIFNYEFNTFDSVILPLSMPYGGMENVNLCTLSRTLLSGDRQNVDVVAHELAHSWSGNLVTNCSWEHFWLNEGWTVYLERRIIGAIHGEPTRHFSAIIGWSDLENSIKAMGDKSKRYSCLVQNLKDKSDPDDAFSTVPYEKGFNLLFHIETILGGKEIFDPFIPYYFKKFKRQSLDTYQFLDSLYEFFNDKKNLLDTIDWKLWLFTPGLPLKPKFDTTLVDQCYSLSEKWISSIREKLTLAQYEKKFHTSDIENFSANQNVVFIDDLISYQGKDGFSWNSVEAGLALQAMEKLYSKYSKNKNAEVVFRWLRLKLTARIKDSYPILADWLGTVGRMKFVRPGYVLLNEVDPELARTTFYKYEKIYNPICVALVKKDLGIS